MKYFALPFFLFLALLPSCEKDKDAIPTVDTPNYTQDNIFGCDQFEVMELEEGFISNEQPELEVFHEFFVIENREGLIIKEGFNGPTLQIHEMDVNGLQIFNDKLMICANEGLFLLNAAGEMDTITEQRCYDMALDGQGRLMLQGIFGDPGLGSSYDIHEFKNNTIAPFAARADFFDCVSVHLEAGSGEWLYGISCNNEIAAYENGVIRAGLDNNTAPLFAPQSGWFLYTYHEGGLIAFTLDISDTFRMYKLVGTGWLPLYDLQQEAPEVDEALVREVLLYVDENTFVHNGFLYTFGGGGGDQRPAITRFDVSGNDQKSWEDIELIQIPGLRSMDIIDIVTASDGTAYAVLIGGEVVKMSC
jgi:hypothetical protein